MNEVLPLVSIIIPTYNRRELLMETLNSVKEQIFINWECIIVDDGGNDNTEMEMLELVNNDSRFRYFRRPQNHPKGACGCRNFGFEKSNGKYIQWLDDDDLLSANKIELQVESLEKLYNINLFVTCSWDLYWPNKKLELINRFKTNGLINKQDFFKRLAEDQTFVPSLAYLTSRELILKSGYWNTDLTINQDAEFFTRILINSEGLVNISDCHVLYRQHEGSRISTRRSEQNIKSFFLSLSLMQSYLKAYDIEAKNYFKWKLLKWFIAYYKAHPNLLKKYYYLFKENGIDLNLHHYYYLKYGLYKKLNPVYKSIKMLKS